MHKPENCRAIFHIIVHMAYIVELGWLHSSRKLANRKFHGIKGPLSPLCATRGAILQCYINLRTRVSQAAGLIFTHPCAPTAARRGTICWEIYIFCQMEAHQTLLLHVVRCAVCRGARNQGLGRKNSWTISALRWPPPPCEPLTRVQRRKTGCEWDDFLSSNESSQWISHEIGTFRLRHTIGHGICWV